MMNRWVLRVACLVAIFAGAPCAGQTRPGATGATGAGGPAKLEIPKVSRDQVICFALYMVSNNTLKLTAQLYPLDAGDARTVRLEVKKDGQWLEVATTTVIEPGFTAPFRVEKWDSTKDHEYRVRHGADAVYTGRIRKDPVDKETIVVAAFTGNGNSDRGPRPDIIRNIKAQDPDLLFFSGDQVYDHGQHYASWLQFGRQFGEIIRDYPTITIPDDHDVGQGNLWGAGGSRRAETEAGDDGGYHWPTEFVNEVERAQTSHLPDPYEPQVLPIGIGVYYTHFNLGGISFAIIEDRKFKTGPKGLVPVQGPRPDHVNDPNYDPKSVDVPGAKLLGDKQEAFLEEWGKDWTGAKMKVVLSQTIFANAAHVHGSLGGRLLADLDSNGWPQAGRNKAVSLMRKSFALHIGGDQHLATVIQHGIDDYGDANWSFCVPSIVNYYNRWWWPLVPSARPVSADLEMTGDYEDGFGNKLTMHAYANPRTDNDRAAGYGLVRLNKKDRSIRMECWPRHVDVTDPNARQYRGWPVTINQLDNYGKSAVAYLPTIQVRGTVDPVIQIVDEGGEVVYTLRISGSSFRPKVFKQGTYTIHVGEGPTRKTLRGITSLPPDQHRTITVDF